MYDPKAWCQFEIVITREEQHPEAVTKEQIEADEQIADQIRKWLEEVGTRVERTYPGLYFSKVNVA